jgi:VanZ family protein
MNETLRRLPQSRPRLTALYYWLPPLLWMGAIFLFSTDLFSVRSTGGTLAALLRRFDPRLTAEQIEVIQFYVRKAGHFTVYAVLAALLMRAFRGGSPSRWRARWALRSLVVVAVYALLDEYHQSFTSYRSASVYDSLIDLAGGAAMIFVWWLWSRWEGVR